MCKGSDTRMRYIMEERLIKHYTANPPKGWTIYPSA